MLNVLACKTKPTNHQQVADDKQYQADYVFCKASLTSAEVKAWVKAEGVTGIPHIGVYSPEGKKLLGMGASVKKMEAVKSNLSSIAQHKVRATGWCVGVVVARWCEGVCWGIAQGKEGRAFCSSAPSCSVMKAQEAR